MTYTLCVLLAQLPGIEQRDRRVAASIQFQVGDKCQVRIAEQTYRGEVSRLDATPGCHMVSVGGGGEGKGRGLGGVNGREQGVGGIGERGGSEWGEVGRS